LLNIIGAGRGVLGRTTGGVDSSGVGRSMMTFSVSPRLSEVHGSL
jgi:hypothetical protein